MDILRATPAKDPACLYIWSNHNPVIIQDSSGIFSRQDNSTMGGHQEMLLRAPSMILTHWWMTQMLTLLVGSHLCISCEFQDACLSLQPHTSTVISIYNVSTFVWGIGQCICRRTSSVRHWTNHMYHVVWFESHNARDVSCSCMDLLTPVGMDCELLKFHMICFSLSIENGKENQKSMDRLDRFYLIGQILFNQKFKLLDVSTVF